MRERERQDCVSLAQNARGTLRGVAGMTKVLEGTYEGAPLRTRLQAYAYDRMVVLGRGGLLMKVGQGGRVSGGVGVVLARMG